eukprot:TRINITY_DN72413_c0_g1_i1.p1 TRINITY_DN72413_c0_g1~~TRINITY_DN72413_c0_g1_i1.p1  ORF type:complete len:587 (+),score=153.15 TRINITY_DN72413_c0_g1_i1:74-1762(+)
MAKKTKSGKSASDNSKGASPADGAATAAAAPAPPSNAGKPAAGAPAQEVGLHASVQGISKEVASVRETLESLKEQQKSTSNVVYELNQIMVQLDLQKVNGFTLCTKETGVEIGRMFELDEWTKEEDERQMNHVKTVGHASVALAASKKPENREIVEDSVMSFVIALNAIYMGIAMDLAPEGMSAWFVVDQIFTGIFIVELLFKLKVNGFKAHFCGKGWASSCFDAFLITFDVVQLVMLAASTAGSLDSLGIKASLFRVVRLARLGRIVRLFKSPVFKDLIAMIQGMLGGMSTLMWALALYAVIVYVFALVFRELLGRSNVEHVSAHFGSVWRSMFTVFRCSFGDCSATGGVPIFEHVVDNAEFPAYIPIGYCIFMFVTTIGLFNVISAIFVEATMAVAQSLESKKKKERLHNQTLFANNITIVVKELLRIYGHPIPEKLSDEAESIVLVDVPSACIDELVKSETAAQALLELDIDEADFGRLNDILDPDNSGTICVGDLVIGISKLRGDQRRSDIVCVDLMIRTMQKTVYEIHKEVTTVLKRAKEQTVPTEIKAIDEPDAKE